MQEAYLDINGIPTRVITWGKWVEDGFKEDEVKELILCIPGNPGVTEMYIKFLDTLHQELGEPIWIVGHAGHEKPKDKNIRMPDLTGNEDLFNLSGQIKHKIAFIEKYVPKDVKIHFIGHSVGAHIIMNMLRIPSIKSRMIKNYYLFPTIERLQDTPNGRFMIKYIEPSVPIILFFAWIFTLLPYTLQMFLIYVYCKVERIENYQINPIISFVDPYVLRNVFLMAFDQIYCVVERDDAILKENKDLIKLYYGNHDNWVPQDCCDNLKQQIPDIDATMCIKGFAHIIVHRDSVPLGKLVASWFKEQ